MPGGSGWEGLELFVPFLAWGYPLTKFSSSTCLPFREKWRSTRTSSPRPGCLCPGQPAAGGALSTATVVHIPGPATRRRGAALCLAGCGAASLLPVLWWPTPQLWYLEMHPATATCPKGAGPLLWKPLQSRSGFGVQLLSSKPLLFSL